MSAAAPAKSLKDQYRWSLWLAIAANALLLAYVLQGGPSPPDLAALIGRASGLLPVGFACLTTTVVNGARPPLLVAFASISKLVCGEPAPEGASSPREDWEE